MQPLHRPKTQGHCKNWVIKYRSDSVCWKADVINLLYTCTSKPSFIIMSLSSNKGKRSVVLCGIYLKFETYWLRVECVDITHYLFDSWTLEASLFSPGFSRKWRQQWRRLGQKLRSESGPSVWGIWWMPGRQDSGAKQGWTKYVKNYLNILWTSWTIPSISSLI